jgi:hypothetical protein
MILILKANNSEWEEIVTVTALAALGAVWMSI